MSLSPDLLTEIRNRFAHVSTCPFQGPRVFFENAGGALTLKSVVETSTIFAAIPDNQGRDNPASKKLVEIITKSRADMRLMMNAKTGQFLTGESGTELLFRTIRAACIGTKPGDVIGSSLEHPATRSAAKHWGAIGAHTYIDVPHTPETGTVTAQDYSRHITPETRVATILHTSPVTGMGVDVAAVSTAIRKVAPQCYIIVDGIQHAAHGQLDINAYNIDAYVISPYKMFSRHGYGIAWISDRLTALPHDVLINGPQSGWELGTRDTGCYAAFSDVVRYFEWLGGHVSDAPTPRGKIEAAGNAIQAHEKTLADAMLQGTGNLKGLAEMANITIIGGADNPAREGLVSFIVANMPSFDVVEKLNAQGIRTHIRRADHYSGNILDPLGKPDCIRVSLCHYNTLQEVTQFLGVMKTIAD